MPFEVELKAWIDDPEDMKQRLDHLGSFTRHFVKDDTYFVGMLDPGAAGSGQPREFRLRGDSGEWICTFKEKQIVDGVETNDEREFFVSDPENFRELLLRLGCRETVHKHKSGLEYSVNGIKAEVVEIRHVGHFIELERMIEVLEPEKRNEAEADIRGLLETLGVGTDRIEPRPYTRMIKEALGRA
jgi:adenylate cyclase class 2